ncbi:MAG TPA: DsbA family protein [Candidatus Kryptonia bacterium]|nr:DsbA family protein [Candidatus Kryptonia bacterium]
MNRRWQHLPVVVACLIVVAKTSAVSAADQSAVLATLDGEPITEADIRKMVQGKLIGLESQMYDARKEGVDTVITNRLLEREATSRKITVAKLLADDVDSHVPNPDPAQVEAVYNENKAQIQQPLEAVRDLLAQQMHASALQAAREEYARQLRAKAKITMKLQAPIVDVPGSGPSRGPANAPVTIIEFSDYQCPFCGQAEQSVQQVLSAYKDQVRLVYRDFPLSEIHPHAQKAAEAARCAGDQGKYWEYHSKLFQNQKQLAASQLEQLAADLQLDKSRFQQCLNSSKHEKAVLADFETGSSVGVSGTPAFFINGRFYSGALPFENFKEVIDEILQQKKPSAS